MAARGLMVLTALLLGCHTASALAMHLVGPRMFSTAPRLPPPALAMRSIGAQLACVSHAFQMVHELSHELYHLHKVNIVNCVELNCSA